MSASAGLASMHFKRHGARRQKAQRLAPLRFLLQT